MVSIQMKAEWRSGSPQWVQRGNCKKKKQWSPRLLDPLSYSTNKHTYIPRSVHAELALHEPIVAQGMYEHKRGAFWIIIVGTLFGPENGRFVHFRGRKEGRG